MSGFEYVMVLFSIIVGLAITTLIDGFIRAFRRDTDLRPGPIHTLWVVLVFNYIILFWVARWELAGIVPEWTPGLVLASLLLPGLLYGLAALLFPAAGEHVALDDYFIENRRVLFGISILLQLATLMSQHLFLGAAETVVNGGLSRLITLMLIPVYAFLMWTSNRRVHLGVAAVLNLVVLWLYMVPGFFVR